MMSASASTTEQVNAQRDRHRTGQVNWMKLNEGLKISDLNWQI